MARWSRNIAVFSVQLVLVAIVLHRLLSLSTPVTLNLFLTALAGAALAIVLALAAFVAIWRDGRSGAWRAFWGMALGLALFAWPAAVMPLYRKLPPIHDITTDTALPPSFVALAARPAGANPPTYAGPEVARQQLEAYPDVRPVIVSRPIGEAWEVMTETIRRLRWNVAKITPPAGRGQPGYIEAVDRTLVLGFYDDVVVRVDGDGRQTRIDVRSQSRYGVHDFGRNAARIKGLFKEFQTRLDATVTGADTRRRRSRGERQVPRSPKASRERGSARSR